MSNYLKYSSWLLLAILAVLLPPLAWAQADGGVLAATVATVTPALTTVDITSWFTELKMTVNFAKDGKWMAALFAFVQLSTPVLKLASNRYKSGWFKDNGHYLVVGLGVAGTVAGIFFCNMDPVAAVTACLGSTVLPGWLHDNFTGTVAPTEPPKTA